MPQGGIDTGEDPREAAFRELYEETGVRSAELLAEAPDWIAYDLPAVVAGRAWKGAIRGQTQKWFAFRFPGSDEEIDIRHPAGAASPSSTPGAGSAWTACRPDHPLQAAGLRARRRGLRATSPAQARRRREPPSP